MVKQANKKYYVYWMRNASCTDEKIHGYVGMTQNPEKRESRHMCETRNTQARRGSQAIPTKVQPDATMEILLEGDLSAALNYERKLRPTPNIGWNKATGGLAHMDGEHEACVYWVRDATCSNHETDGYIGVTTKPKSRMQSHAKNFAKNERVIVGELQIEILFRGSFTDCYNKEQELRETAGIGWNLDCGGFNNRGGAPTKENIANQIKAYASKTPEQKAETQRLAAATRARNKAKAET